MPLPVHSVQQQDSEPHCHIVTAWRLSLGDHPTQLGKLNIPGEIEGPAFAAESGRRYFKLDWAQPNLMVLQQQLEGG